MSEIDGALTPVPAGAPDVEVVEGETKPLKLDPEQIAWAEIQSEVNDALKSTLTLAFLGSASAGKDAAIRALFGIDYGQVCPIPGSTERLRVAALDAEEQVLVVNAPGFGDVRAEVDALARQAMEHLDVVVYVLNADGGATIDERRDLDAIRARAGGEQPTLICVNKIDLIRPHQREEFLARTAEQLNVQRSDMIATAFDPLPQIFEDPVGVQEVIAWIWGRLEGDGKSLLFAKQLRDKAAACRPIIQEAARKAAIAGAVPVPGADITAVTAIQVKLISQIAAVHGHQIDRAMAVWIIGEVLAGSSKGFIRWGIQTLKAAGWIPGAQIAEVATAALAGAVAAGTTFGVGEATIRYIQSGYKLGGDELRAVFDQVAAAKTRAIRAGKEHLLG